MRFIALLPSLLFVACGELAQYSDEQELYYNYLLLKAYFYRPERVKEHSAYKRMEVGDMYESLEDYFCGANYTGDCKEIYTYYLPPEKSEQKISEIENTQKHYSFGFERVIKDDTLVISAVYPNSPANGVLKKRDKLLFANDVSLSGTDINRYLSSDTVFKTSTAFTVLRGEKTLILDTIQKSEVQKPTVFLDSLEGIPFIRITGYKLNTNNPDGTYAEFKNVLQEINGAKIAIIDLRSNPGGSIGHCTAMAAELVPFDNELIYDVEHYYHEQRGNIIDTVHYFAKDFLESKGAGTDINWIILMNRWSASCAERFAAIVKYNRHETVIIGETSYGKGIGQIYTKTYLGGLAYITCIQSFYPNGETFHNTGIKPTVPIESGDASAIYYAAINAALNFGLAKRLPATIQLKDLPQEHKAEKTDFGAHKRRLFHQWK